MNHSVFCGCLAITWGGGCVCLREKSPLFHHLKTWDDPVPLVMSVLEIRLWASLWRSWGWLHRSSSSQYEARTHQGHALLTHAVAMTTTFTKARSKTRTFLQARLCGWRGERPPKQSPHPELACRNDCTLGYCSFNCLSQKFPTPSFLLHRWEHLQHVPLLCLWLYSNFGKMWEWFKIYIKDM